LWLKTPEQFKDLKRLEARAGATVEDLVAAVANAEVIQQAEKTWLDALNESVVTFSELHDLQLTPRKKLLGDWFCEGDLGFIFGFRGVGKTWLALAVAQALSTAGKFGDWHTGKVLNITNREVQQAITQRCVANGTKVLILDNLSTLAYGMKE